MAERGLPWEAWVVIGTVLAIVVVLFVQTNDPMLLVFGAFVSINLGVAWWVAHDAPKVGQPRVPWAVACAIAPGIGLVAYLVVRWMHQPVA